MAYLRNKKDFTNEFLLNRSLSFKAYKTYITAIWFQNSTKNIRFTLKATAYAGDKGKMHSICRTPELSARRELFAMGLKL